MDTDAILKRRPRVAVVDEFPHTNVPGSPSAKRWEDVHVLLDAGIDVLTTMNVQHLESLNDQIWQSTGVRVRETIPDWVLKQADEVVMVDLTPRALLNRLARGAVYPADASRRPCRTSSRSRRSSPFGSWRCARPRTWSRVSCPTTMTAASTPVGRTRPRTVLLLLSSDPSIAALIRRGRRVADYLRADCLAAYVSRTPTCRSWPPERERLERHLNFARGLRIETRILQGTDIAETVVEFARLLGVTQIFVTREKPAALRAWFASASCSGS